MKKLLPLSLSIFVIAISYNCKRIVTEPNLGDVQLNLPSNPYSYNSVFTPQGSKSVIYENSMAVSNTKATIGRVLFYDKALSLNNSVACASCHLQKNAFSDVVAFSKGFEEKSTVRNSMGISNLIKEVGIGYFWDARETQIESMVFAPIANHIEMGFEKIDLISEKISNLPYYKKLFRDCYGDENVTTQRMRECMGNFLFSIVSQNSKFDIGVGSNFSNFNASERRGKDIFLAKNCGTCHFVSNNLQSSYGAISFANIGLDEKDIDPGINGQYKIPKLANVSKTAPYMHDGRFKTLEEVIEHYSHNIKNNQNLNGLLRDFSGGKQDPKRFDFTEQEKADLVAFLKTFDDNVVCTDVKFSNPFNN